MNLNTKYCPVGACFGLRVYLVAHYHLCFVATGSEPLFLIYHPVPLLAVYKVQG